MSQFSARKILTVVLRARLLTTLAVVLRAAGLGLALASTATAQQSGVFYAIGAEEDQVVHSSPPTPGGLKRYKGIHLYEVDGATLRVVRSMNLDFASGSSSPTTAWFALSGDMGMLTGDHKTIVLLDGGNEDETRLALISTLDLSVKGRMEIPMSEMPTNSAGDRVDCTDHIFVHPVTGRVYFTCELGRGGIGALEVDPFERKVISTDLPTSLYTKNLLYDSKRQYLYISGMAPAMLDLQDRVVGHIGAIQLPGGSKLYVTGMALLPNGNLVLLHHTSGVGSAKSVLALYDPSQRKPLATWEETRSYTDDGVEYVAGKLKEKQRRLFPFLIENVPVPSRDGSRLFGVEGNWGRYDGSTPPPYRAVMWDANTLQMLHTWDLPERPSFECAAHGKGSGSIACFAPAPDGRGVWFFGQSGKIYRLDDHTGELIDEVKLPFHLVSLIREP